MTRNQLALLMLIILVAAVLILVLLFPANAAVWFNSIMGQ